MMPATHSAQKMNWPATRPTSSRRLGWKKYLPAGLFLAFLLPNTHLSPVNDYMMIGRWGALLAIVGLTVLSTHRMVRWPTINFALVLLFLLLALTLPGSSNVPISAAKWSVFFAFLIFCGVFLGQIRSREEATAVVEPLTLLFLILIWANLISIGAFPQRQALGNLSGFMKYTGALGQFMALFGVPALLYRLEVATSGRQRKFLIATLGVTLLLVVLSGSRTASISIALVLGIAFWRWKHWQGRFVLPTKILILLLGMVLFPYFTDNIERFVQKYPNASSLLDSRVRFWSATTESFMDRRWTGSGFGVQEQQAEVALTYASRGAFREQGSTYLGLLEEVGILGALPFFLLLATVGLRSAWSLFRAADPLTLLCARTVCAGLLWGVAENYLFYLGNAASILVFYGIFLRERLAQLDFSRRLQQQREQAFLAELRRAAGPALEPSNA